ncbi:MAG: type II toxin-antitoxin system VapC family toxin [Elusimicrobia bacterium]|nr:type II toxin-antitoxin system VapC family toxin [Elusimicrobiota bacterium]
MNLYLDTSCLAKAYIQESGSDIVLQQIGQAELIATSLISYPEMRGALTRRLQEKHLRESDYRKLLHQFEKDWPCFVRIPVAEELALQAGKLAARHLLRGLDAIHLACAIKLKRSGAAILFYSADQKLNRAAHKEGFRELYPAI